jgi:hypothetical protein
MAHAALLYLAAGQEGVHVIIWTQTTSCSFLPSVWLLAPFYGDLYYPSTSLTPCAFVLRPLAVLTGLLQAYRLDVVGSS